MKTTMLIITIIMCYYILTPVNKMAQIQGKKYDNPQWKRVELIEFRHDKMDRVREIIKDYFIKAADKGGSRQPASILEMTTGEWNMMLVWNMKDGLEEMNWETNPDDMKWITAMNEIAGSADKAKAILDEGLRWLYAVPVTCAGNFERKNKSEYSNLKIVNTRNVISNFGKGNNYLSSTRLGIVIFFINDFYSCLHFV
jgi:hypothetical protein